jgi:hypothetical protein
MVKDPRWRQADDGPVIDMTADGRFVDRPMPQPGVPPVPSHIIGMGVLVAAVAGGLAIAALALWLALTLIPIAIAGAAIAYGVFRFQMWWARRPASLGGHRDLFRP